MTLVAGSKPKKQRQDPLLQPAAVDAAPMDAALASVQVRTPSSTAPAPCLLSVHSARCRARAAQQGARLMRQWACRVQQGQAVLLQGHCGLQGGKRKRGPEQNAEPAANGLSKAGEEASESDEEGDEPTFAQRLEALGLPQVRHPPASSRHGWQGAGSKAIESAQGSARLKARACRRCVTRLHASGGVSLVLALAAAASAHD